MSPILANIYLNEVVDQWFLKNYGNYNNIMVRYADDAVFFFKKENDAKDFMLQFKTKIEEFGLSLNMHKYHWDSFARRLEFSPLPTPPRVEQLMKLGKTYGNI